MVGDHRGIAHLGHRDGIVGRQPVERREQLGRTRGRTLAGDYDRKRAERQARVCRYHVPRLWRHADPDRHLQNVHPVRYIEWGVLIRSARSLTRRANRNQKEKDF